MGEDGCRAAVGESPDSTPSATEPSDGGGGIDVRWLIAAGVVAAGAAGAGAVITRRRFLGTGALVGVAMTMRGLGAPHAGRAPAPRASGEDEPRPNIVWFRSEDNGADLIGAYGNPSARTPNIDRLASEGVRFSRFFTTSPVCAPTKLGWATGMYEAGMGPGEHMRAQGRRPEFAVGFASWLAAAGYWCTTSGNVDYNADLSEDHGFHIDWRGSYEVRRVMLEAGRRLAALGALDARDDVFFLTFDELRAALAAQGADHFQGEVVARKAEMAHFAQIAPPQFVGAIPAGLDEWRLALNAVDE